MRAIFIFFSVLFYVIDLNAQTSQISIGTLGKTETFYDTKIDPNDAGVVNVGFINDPLSGNGNDLFIVKLNSNHQINWQKTIANAGDDVFYKVIICANGDYIAVGHKFVAGVRRAIACRINSSNGNILWTSISSNSGLGEVFWDAVETTNSNIALVGADSYSPSQTNSFIVLLDAGGTTLWSKVSSTILADEFRSIAQLPNGKLLAVGFYNPGTSTYHATISELNEVDGSISTQNTYSINTSVPGGPTQNSLWSGNIFIKNNTVLIYFIAFQGFGSAPNQCVYTYDQTTKNLTGNIYYHTGVSNGDNYSFYPLTENDFLISQGYLSPSKTISVSRITNGTVVFDRKINGNVSAIYAADVLNSNVEFAGHITDADIDGFNLFSDLDVPSSNSGCGISDLNTLALQSSNLTAVSQTVISLSASPVLGGVVETVLNTAYNENIVCTTVGCAGQTTQISIGSLGKTETFYDTKIDPNDAGVVNVGFINDPLSGNGNDLFIVKLNSNHQINWQKTIANAGDDVFYKVIICANGDYIAVGHKFVAGVRRAIACRINSSNGNILWTSISSNSGLGEVFWDAVETTNSNIALVGADSYSPSQTNSFIVLLDAGGTTLWSKVSSTILADEFRSIAQLPNGKLLVVGFYNPGSSTYHATISELNEVDGSISTQNTYSINTSVPGGPTQNSLWSGNIFIRNNTVLIYFIAFQGFGSTPNQCIYTYDQTSKNLTGNIYYHTGVSNGDNYSFYPLTENDFLISQGYLSPSQTISVSRITNGTIVFDREINGNVSALYAADVLNSNVEFAGHITDADTDGFNLFSPICIPTSLAPCDIADQNTLALQVSNLSANALNVVALSASTVLSATTLTTQTPAYIVEDVCGLIIPVTLLNFNARYNSVTENTLLDWSTATELNSKSFIIERSNNGGRSFEPIGNVNAAGNSNTIIQYQFTDKNPQNGINLYRLKQVDLDGKFQYSNIVSIEVKRKQDGIYSLYPVPANSGYSYLSSSETAIKLVNITIIDVSGKIIKQLRSYIDKTKPVKLELENLSRGIYFVKIISGNNAPSTIKLSVE